MLKCDCCNGDVSVVDSRVIIFEKELVRKRKYKCKKCGEWQITYEHLKGVHTNGRVRT